MRTKSARDRVQHGETPATAFTEEPTVSIPQQPGQQPYPPQQPGQPPYYGQPPMAPAARIVPPAKPKRFGFVALAVAAVAGLFVGGMIGGFSSGATTSALPAPAPTVTSTLPTSGTIEVTYEIRGAVDPFIDTFTVEDKQISWTKEASVETSSKGKDLSAKITDVDYHTY